MARIRDVLVKERHTDLGNARRLVAFAQGGLRFDVSRAKWLRWKETRWVWDDAAAMRIAKATARATLRCASEIEDDERRQRLTAHALKSENRPKLQAMLDLAKTEQGVGILPGDLDQDPYLLNLLNGTLDLRTGKLREHRKDDLITKLAPVAFDPEAYCSEWVEFLDDVTGGRPDLAKFLQRLAGYSLLGGNQEEVFVVLFGPGGTGKTTFLEVIKSTIGDYAKTADFETFLSQKFDRGPRNDLAGLRGARFVTASETSPGRELDGATVKQITGGDTISARFLYKEAFEFRADFVIFMATNSLPKIRSDDSGMWRRVVPVPFEVVVPSEDRDPQLKTRLSDPSIGGPGVMAWLVEGCLEYQRAGLRIPPAVEQAQQHYMLEMARFETFFSECCVFDPGVWTPSADLFARYRDWEDANGIARRPDRELQTRLKEQGCEARKLGQARGWQGIGLVRDTRDTEDTNREFALIDPPMGNFPN